MANSIGTMGTIEVFEDFLGLTSTTMGTVAAPQGSQGVMYVSVNEGSFAQTTDEPGGIIAVTNDTANNDNCALYVGPFKPADGGCEMEVRVKIADITTGAIFVGFTETLNATTPVCPLEFATATMTYNGTGGMAGFIHDSNATSGTADWRASAGDANKAATNADANGTRANQPPVNDKWDVLRVEIDSAGNAEMYLSSDKGTGFRLIKRVEGAVTSTDLQFATILMENRSAAASVWEVDYFYAKGNVDWTR